MICGSGRVGIGQSGDEAGFQLSQRADYIEVEVGLETTLKRGIINTRDEPHADADKYRRLHVIIGDANLAEMSTYLKVGTTALVLDLIEAGVDLTDLQLARPVTAVHHISHDPTLRKTVALAGRPGTDRAGTATDLPRAGREVRGQRAAPTTRAVATFSTSGRWCSTCSNATRWSARTCWTGRRSCACSRDSGSARAWRGRRRDCTWWICSTPTCDSTRGSTTGWWRAARWSGSSPNSRCSTRSHTPPTDTRAYFRGECLRRFGADIAAASWDSVIFDLGGESLVRIPTLEPLRGSRAHVGELLDSVRSRPLNWSISSRTDRPPA